MIEKSEKERKIIIAVTSQVINMLNNNVLEDNGSEPFEGWCGNDLVWTDENGNDFSEDEIKEAQALVEKVAPLVDELHLKYLNFGY